MEGEEERYKEQMKEGREGEEGREGPPCRRRRKAWKEDGGRGREMESLAARAGEEGG